jgi:hypothetical protein
MSTVTRMPAFGQVVFDHRRDAAIRFEVRRGKV